MHFEPDLTIGTVLCCDCGTPIKPNPSNKCANCLRAQVDITQSISRQNLIMFCHSCERYLQPPKNWISCSLESPQLLSICLKTLKGLNKVRLAEAKFVWTEPHSKRIIVRLTVQKEISGAVLQQEFDVVYVVKNQQCDLCTRSMTNEPWQAIVQIRQRVDHKRTFLFLEQQILKHKQHLHTLKIKSMADGLDFYFSQQSHSLRLSQFVEDLVPTQVERSERLVSTDAHSNTANKKHTTVVNIAPVCRDDLIFLSEPLARNQICLVHKITKDFHLVDPMQMRCATCPQINYWKNPFQVIASTSLLSEFMVVNVESTGKLVGKFEHARVELYYTRGNLSVGEGGQQQSIQTRTHLGHLLKYGDTVLGYDLRTLQIDDEVSQLIKKRQIDDVIIVRKSYPLTAERVRRRRFWHLKRFDNVEDDDAEQRRDALIRKNKDEEMFTRLLEEDKDLRTGITIFKNKDIDPMELEAEKQGSKVKEEVKGDMEKDNEEQVEEDNIEDDEMLKLEELVDELEISFSGPGQEIADTPQFS
ncbi:MAG: putative 60S ribosomal export protein nmd3 [Streblomastix strix]|uniref:60S ribosomal export protein NMD3 n=1 Tax=Streblomastix strix TaxID=222440 RepID=A0A5J4W2J9_9EUKA|nr:MAG: putative 60S ribosomal export protein nmd3 [Streblomastix strix]